MIPKFQSTLEINLLKYFTLKRLNNILKILISFSISKIIRKPVVWGMPISYSIEPTNFCNLKCPECPSGTGELTRPLGLMDVQHFENIINQINSTGFYLQLFFQGEPYLHKQLPEMIKYAQNKNIHVSVSTNGNLITQKNIDRVMESPPDKIIFSIDGLDEESYQNYRIGGTFKQADESLQLFVDTKNKLKLRKPYIELQFIVMKQNQHLLPQVRAYSEQKRVDRLVFKTMQVTSYENALKYLPSEKEHSRYIVANGSYQMKGKIKDHCFALWRTAVITWDNKMVPCCFDKDAKYILENLNQSTIETGWKSKAYQQFRSSVLHNRQGNPMCTNCTEGLKINIFQFEN